LVFANKDKKGLPGEQLALAEMDSITGGCCGLPRPPQNLGAPPPLNCPPPPPPPAPDSCPVPPPPPPPGCGSGAGQPIWQVNPINMNFYMKDIPLWYKPAKGPTIEFKLSYNSQSSINYYEPFSHKWQLNYNTVLVEAPGGNVTVFWEDGKQVEFVYNNGSYSLQPLYGETAILAKLAPNTFTLTHSNGTVYTYSIPDGANSLQTFLTSIKDAHNNQITLKYNAKAQLTSIIDADNKTSTLTYNPKGLVSRITDPFGRNANFTYDTAGSLIRIVDMGASKQI
jgi:YD repeat-containing protein